MQTIRFFFLLSTALSLLLVPELHANTLEYLYINAGEGNASGGHTALRFDADTFHFQHYDGGIIRLVKHGSNDFDYQYRYLENRTFHQATIELKYVHYQQLWQHFNLRFLLQKQQDALISELKKNIVLLSKQYQHPALSIKGAGLFAINANPSKTEALVIRSIQAQIKQTYGDAYLDKQIQRLNEEINTIKIFPWPENSLQMTTNSFLTVPYSFASRHIDSVSKILLLETLKNETPLNPQHYFSPDHAHFQLSKQQIEQLKLLQKTLFTQLLNLLNSQRPDWGSAGFILYARLLSLAYTIQSGKFVFLDSFATNTRHISSAEVATYKDLLLAQNNQALNRIYQQKKHLFATQKVISEKNYSRFEKLSNYYYERERALKTGYGLRISGEMLLPEKSIVLPKQFFPVIDSQQAEIAISRLKKYQQKLTQQLKSLYRYNLFTRNCVTEIFSSITNAQINNKQISDLQQLINKSPVAFIPFNAFDRIAKHYPTKTLPSYRQQQLHKMYNQENSIRVYLREFNTLSAKNYKYNDQDALFLFFTDDKPWLRPLFGSANILAATSISIYGSFTFPFDSGKTLRSGMMGILMSLPEFAFFNIRKGSYKYLGMGIE